jgi:glycerol-3-phosphate acyltransferase PlsY
VSAVAVLPLVTLCGSWYHGRIHDGTWNKPLFAFSVVVAVLGIWKHRANLQRLFAGTENRFEKRPKTPRQKTEDKSEEELSGG